MGNKIAYVILALLVIIMGGIGYYSYTLYQQVDDLSDQLTAYENEQTVRLETVTGDLQQQITSGLDTLEDQVIGIETDINNLDTELAATGNAISNVEEGVTSITSQVESLDDRVTHAEANLSYSIITAGDVFDSVSQAMVRITDGQSVIGSGFIMDVHGYVITAHHVIENLSPIFVMMYDGRISRANVIGSSSVSDVAVLKLQNNPAIEGPPMGDSSLIRIGEPVVAIGSPGDNENPLALRDTLTSGIISQVNRFVDIEGNSIANLLQFDAAVNFGNSGCPLFNTRGEVIGLVIARISPTLGDGLNWAVSSNKVKRVAEAVIASGYFAYPWIGIGISDLTPEFVEQEHLETANGVLVDEVFTGGPARSAGIKTDDIIVSCDGLPIRDNAELTSYLGEYKSPGDDLIIEVIRENNIFEIVVEVGTR